MGLLVEYSVLDKVKVINEGTGANKKLKVRGKFQKCDEQNNNGRIYPRKILESQVKELQGKIAERSLVGALDHPSNDAIHLSQASHLITKLWVEKNGEVMGEAEILSTPNGKIVEALLKDGVKIGISSRGLGTLSEGKDGKVVNEDFKLITFDLVSDPSTKGAFPELAESMNENTQKVNRILSKHRKENVFLTLLEAKIDEALSEGAVKKVNKARKNAYTDSQATYGNYKSGDPKKRTVGRAISKNSLPKGDNNMGWSHQLQNAAAEKRKEGKPKMAKEFVKGSRSFRHADKRSRGGIKKSVFENFELRLKEGVTKALNKRRKKDWETKKGGDYLASGRVVGKPDNGMTDGEFKKRAARMVHKPRTTSSDAPGLYSAEHRDRKIGRTPKTKDQIRPKSY